MTINIAGHSVTTGVDYFGEPNTIASLTISHNEPSVPGDQFMAFVGNNQNTNDPAFFGTRIGLGITLADPTGKALPENSPNVFEDLDLSKFSTRYFYMSSVDGGQAVAGSITSLTNVGTGQTTTAPGPSPTPAPEPTTLALFALAGIGVVAGRRLRGRG